MSAEQYNKIRRIIFSTANNPRKGFSVAREWLDTTYRRQLGAKEFKGLSAELSFYERYGREYCLTVAGDMGEHADFAGMYGTFPTRFDVTTNVDFKKFADYEPYLGRGPRYKIALLDSGNFELVDVLDLAFPRCQHCNGYLMPAVVLLNQNYNRHGESQWSNDQIVMDVCTGCDEYVEKARTSHCALPSSSEYFDAASESDEGTAAAKTEGHLVDAYKYFRRNFDDMLMIVGSHQYHITDASSGDGHWGITLDFINAAVMDDMNRDPIACGPYL
jgi:hypothetical protein